MTLPSTELRSNRSRPLGLLSCVLCLLLVGTAWAQSHHRPAETQPAAAPAATNPHAGSTAEKGSAEPLATSVTHHTIKVDGKELAYTATAGQMELRDEHGKLQARMFYIAYVLDGQDAARRPIMFAYNGGPGAAALWVNLGVMGPKRLVMPDDGTKLITSPRLVDNEQTWLAFTDLVFIDPVGSGFSVPAAGVDPKTFWSLTGDVHSVGEVIRMYVSANERWLSPKFLAGESYGTIRSAGLARYLQDGRSMDFRGMVLLSSALDFGTFSFGGGSDLPCVLYVPSYAAVAWYHHRLADDLQKKDLDTLRAEAEKWALDTYAPALAMGDSLPEGRRREIAAQFARWTGLSEEYVRLSDLRVPNFRFTQELLRSKGKVTGLLDARVTGFPLDAAGASMDYDPSMALIRGSFGAAMQDYLRRELGVRTDRRYVVLSEKANGSWDWGSARGGYVNVTDQLGEAMTRNSNLKVLAAMGAYDLTCGYFAQAHMFSHLHLPAPLRGNVVRRLYPSGHQVYNDDASRKAFSADVAEFVGEAGR